jgi:hypothetical protein
MRILGVIAFVMTALGSMGVTAQTMGGVPAQGGNQKAAYKANCERDARMIYRQGRDVTVERRQELKATRKAYVQDCLAKAGFAP